MQSSRHLAKSSKSIANAGPNSSDKATPITIYIQNRNPFKPISFLPMIKIPIKMNIFCTIEVFNKKLKIVIAPITTILRGGTNMEIKGITKIAPTQKIPNLQPIKIIKAMIQIHFNNFVSSVTFIIVKK